MSATYTFNAKRITFAILKGVDSGLVAIAAVLGSTVKEMLSRPGRGRVYVRSQIVGGKKKLSRNAIRSARKAGVPITFFRKGGAGAGAFVSRSGLAAILRIRRSEGKSKGTLRSLGFHKASAPGDPPAVDTGTLRRSWQTGFGSAKTPAQSGAKRVLRVGSSLKYAPYMEFGTGRILPRPYLRPSAAKVQKSAQAIMNTHVAAAVRKAGLSK